VHGRHLLPTSARRRVTAKCCERIARRAVEAARGRRKKVTAVHKVNVLRISDALFLREVRKVAQEFPDVQLDEKLIDAMAALILRDPTVYDVIVTTNMFGDIISDEASELSGSLGLAGSVNAGDDLCVAQAQHGSAPDIAGKGIANPTSLILSAGMMLDWMGRRHNSTALTSAAAAIERAIDEALQSPSTRTRDLQGQLGTVDFAKLIADKLA
jgi:3-isopropylmalate dehydrogenase